MINYILHRVEGLTWHQYLEFLIDKLILESFRDLKQWALKALQQSGRSIDEYAIEILDLSRYGHSILATKAMKARGSSRGL